MSFDQPLWRVGFRPFFALGCLAGTLLPLIWVALYSGAVPQRLTFTVSPLIWHAHEMFFAFGGAILAGFLLTASKNWVAIRGYHGKALVVLVALWLLDRVAMIYGGGWPPVLFWLAGSLFTGTFVAMILATLLRHRQHDSYRLDNGYFLLALPLLLPAKWLLLQPDGFASGEAMLIAIFRLAFLLMLERTLSQFMNAAFRLELPRPLWRDHSIKAGALLLIASPWLPQPLAGLLGLACAALLFWRWLDWYPWQALRRLDIGIMYLGQLAIIVQLALAAGTTLGLLVLPNSTLVHVFTLGALGLIVPAMVIRISKGHTGRKVAFDGLDKAVLWLMLAGLLVRTALPLLLPAYYHDWLWLTALCWLLGFGSLGLRYIPWLLQARVDGRTH